MNVDPDYSAAYVTLDVEGDWPAGYGLTFTIGRGNDVVALAVQALSGHVVGRTVGEIEDDLAGFSRSLTGDTQLRWLGPEKGVVQLAAAAIVNAVWDLLARLHERPLWRFLAEMTAEELVRCIDFRYLEDALTPAEALAILRAQAPTRAQRIREMERDGFPAYTTSAGWIGYSDEQVARLTREALAEGFTRLKLKVGADLTSDLRRGRIMREAMGPGRDLLIDANQAWGVDEAIAAMGRLRELEPYWIEEPTSPDDILGHQRIRAAIAPIRVATGEQAQNRIVFKQLFQANAIDVCQVDACRLAGVSEALAVLLLAAKFGVPICPHAGGVGLCELEQHLALFDYVAVGASLEGRVCEHVDSLHEHFLDPVRIVSGRYRVPVEPGASLRMRPASVDEYEFPQGPYWRGAAGHGDGAAALEAGR
ncbi:MAG: enolase C-terminal domain-like protein [Candidatus Dormiibacterota bacterium]